MKRFLTILLLAAASTLAQAWEPTKPVTVIVGNTPGAGNEIAFRKLAAIVQKTNPKFVYVVQNMPGADSVISMNHFLTVPADGLTIALPSHMSTYVTNDIWEKSIKRFEADEFRDVLTMGKSPLVLVANPRSTINSPQEFVKLIKTTTKPINIAVGGGAHRTAFEFLMMRNKGNADMVKPIKFNGPAPAVMSVASFDGEGTEFGIMPIAVAKPLVDSGKVKALGFTGNRRMPQMPNVPLLKDVAPGIDVYAAWSLTLPPRTSADIVEWYQRTFSDAMHTAEYQEWMTAQLVFIDETELTPAGMKDQIKELRAVFLPVLTKIDLSKE